MPAEGRSAAPQFVLEQALHAAPPTGALAAALAADARLEERRTRVWMNGVKDKIWFLREGLFAKYVIALVGLVVFVLAVNGAMEIWISYRGTKTTLNDGMSEKAEATAQQIEQSMSDLERQISWVTRAYSNTRRAAPRRLRATAEAGAAGQPALAAQRARAASSCG